MSKVERTSAGLVVKVDDEIVGAITSFGESYNITEEEVSSSEDTVGVAPNKIIRQRFIATSVGHTANVGGVALATEAGTDTGQSDLKDAVEAGKTVQVSIEDQHDGGKVLTGFFTNYEESAELPNVFRFTASFRVNEEGDLPT